MDTAEALPLIAVAAEPLEFAGLLRHAAAVRPLSWPLAYVREAVLGNRRWILAAHGPGPRLAREAAETALDRCGGCAIVLSTGFCGALDPALRVGDIFAAREVIDAAGRRSYPALPPQSSQEFRLGRLWSQDRVAVSPAEKAALRQHGAEAVDMEAAAVAAEAARCNAPFYCLRVVSDEAREPLPLDFNACRGPDGRFSKSRATFAAFVHPSSLIPLLRFGLTCRRAALCLGDFLASCSF
jgi:adenosylhomocysteine nucleosidase